jgi:uncharacterized protein YdhG (YjbR/CyaY superfamily)
MQGEVKTGAAIDAYVSKKNPKLKPVTDAVRALVRKAVPKSREAINPWGIPTFEWNGTLCYIMVGKPCHLWFSPWQVPAGLGQAPRSTGKNLRHVKLRNPEMCTTPT